MNEKIIWTIGHSTRSFEEFISILKSFGIEQIADIRSFPGSRRFPHFNRELLMKTLPEAGIGYIHMKDLGGRRKASPESVNTGWRLDAFRGYADYMETPEFENAVRSLGQMALEKKTAYMCAEALWWRCHRSLVSDYLKKSGWQVIHITGEGKGTEHTYTRPAKIIDGKLVYYG